MFSKIETEIISFFPQHIKNLFLEVPENILANACEIRFRTSRPILISGIQKEIFLNYLVSSEDILRLVENFSHNSIYAIQNELNSGFITMKGGHRIGISGTSVFEENKMKNIKYISSLNIRIAREIKNCSLEIVDRIVKDDFKNTLLISPPRMWKDYYFKRHDKNP